MKSAIFAVTLVAVAHADDCETYKKISNVTCADACLPASVGICPRDLVVSSGGLKGGACKADGYTVSAGPITQKAGPCGDITFAQYTKPAMGQQRLSAASGLMKLADFGGDNSTTYNWQDQNDPVMGGASVSSFRVDETAQSGVFNGTCALVPFLKAPGFAKITTRPGQAFPDVSAYLSGSVEMRLRTSTPAYTGWRVGFGAKDIPRTSQFGGGSFKGDFGLMGSDWQVVTVPFSSFSYDWSGYTGRCDTQDPAPGPQHYCCTDEHPEVCPTTAFLSTLTNLELWAEGVKGDFHLEVDYIGVTN